MARQTAEQKAAEEAAKQAEAEAKAKLEAEQKAAEDGEDGDMTILEAFAEAERSRNVRRHGWSKALDGHFITIRRGETLPVLSTGKHFSPYTPSIQDVMTKDWYVVEGGK